MRSQHFSKLKKIVIWPLIIFTALFLMFQNCSEVQFSGKASINKSESDSGASATDVIDSPNSSFPTDKEPMSDNPISDDPIKDEPIELLPETPINYFTFDLNMDSEISKSGHFFATLGTMLGGLGTTVSRIDPNNNQPYCTKMLNETMQSEGSAIRVRADGKRAIVVSRSLIEKDDYTKRIYQLWLINEECEILVGPIEYNGNSEFRSFDMDSQGRFAIAINEKTTGIISLYTYDENGDNLYKTEINRFDSGTGNFGITLSLNDQGILLLSEQGHFNNPIYFRRLTIMGEPIDENWVEVEGTTEGHSSWYNSHITGINDNGSFVLLWADSKDLTVKANFYSSEGVKLTNVTLSTSFTNTPVGAFYNLNRIFRVRHSGDVFFLPDDWESSYQFPISVSLYNSTGQWLSKIAPVKKNENSILDTREISFDKNKNFILRSLDSESLVIVKGE